MNGEKKSASGDEDTSKVVSSGQNSESFGDIDLDTEHNSELFLQVIPNETLARKPLSQALKKRRNAKENQNILDWFM